MKNKKFLTLLTLFISYIWVVTFVRSMLPIHFIESGFSIEQMLAGFLFMFSIQLAALLLIKKLSSKFAWRISILFLFAFLAFIVNVKNDVQMYLGMALSGLSLFFFFPIYNIAHFESTPKKKIGTSSALMFSIGPAIGILAPALAGFVAQIDFFFFWILSAILMAITLITINFQENFSLNYSRIAVYEEIKYTRPYIFLEGIWSALVLGIIPVYSITFVKTPIAFGAFLSYIAIISAISNLILGKLTDKLERRAVFLYPLTLILALTTFFFQFALKNFGLWIIFTGIVGFVLPMFWNLSTTLVVDNHDHLRHALIGREIVLSAGRTVGLGLAFLSFTFEKEPKYIFIFLSLSVLLYPVILFYNERIKKHHQYY